MLGYFQSHLSLTNKEKSKVFVEFPDDEATVSRVQEAIYGHFITGPEMVAPHW